MGLTLLAHYNVRTAKLDETRDFYTRVLGLREGHRPPFPFPGAWLYCGDRDVLHVAGIDPEDQSGLQDYLGGRGGALTGGGAIDHVAFTASGAAEMAERFDRLGVAARHRRVPSLTLYQMFVEDPNGITIELNFPGEDLPDRIEARGGAAA